MKIAALAFEITTTGNTIQLLPAGKFKASDGRPFECDSWFLDADLAQSVIAKANSSANRLVIDYEHQTLRAAQNGQPAPASGWFHSLEWRENDGLFATDVEWTANAAAMIAAKEYRYISAVFLYDKTGRVIEVLHAALTNTPALDGMDEVLLAAASYLASLNIPTPPQPEVNPTMEDLLEQLRWMLNLPLSATAEEVKAELQKLIDKLSNGAGTAAASINLIKLIEAKDQKIVALSNQHVDPALYAPVSAMKDLQDQLADLKANNVKRDVNELVTAALSDGRLLPAQETWARDLGQSNLASLSAYLGSASPIAALSKTQTGGNEPAPVNDTTHGLDPDTLAVCSLMGGNPADVAQIMKEEQ